MERNFLLKEIIEAFDFIEGAKTYMKVEKPEHIYETGKAIATSIRASPISERYPGIWM